MIKGGYYIKARCIQESEIAHAPPHAREIWDWILLQANHKDTATCKRGQCIRTYKDIQEGLSWFIGYRKMKYKKHQCENALKWLRKATMITTTKTTRGIVITVCNYDKFQDPKNYECYTKADTKATIKLQPPDTINKNDKKEKNDKNRIINGQSLQIAGSLLFAIQTTKPDFKKPGNLNQWATDIDRMIRIDKRDPDKIKAVLSWLPKSNFWSSNILSGSKLRKQFDRLEIEMEKPASGKKSQYDENLEILGRFDRGEI